ncbi:hypothetical protein BDI4_740028 [Burkholderia diffusa]|nr:hypothetical protein BDI4_740028 [Burkholderia diffusa]
MQCGSWCVLVVSTRRASAGRPLGSVVPAGPARYAKDWDFDETAMQSRPLDFRAQGEEMEAEWTGGNYAEKSRRKSDLTHQI